MRLNADIANSFCCAFIHVTDRRLNDVIANANLTGFFA
jgi:hypothetical protein